MICKICSTSTHPFAQAKLLGKYDVQYFRCQNCGFAQTEEPYWLDEAYSHSITSSDLGLVSRNIGFAKISKAIIILFFDTTAKFIDYGGGYGLFVRLMRDYGFDFYRHDKLCPNLFAKGFDADLAIPNQYELVTAFEVFEHLVNPLAEIERMLQFSNSILFSTMLIPPNYPKPDEWWYYGTEHGQHVGLYSDKTLRVIADKFHLNLYSNGTTLHLMSDKRVPSWLFKIVVRPKIAQMLGAFSESKSLLADDYYRIVGKQLK